MWHEARRSERKVHDLMDAARKRAERRAVYLAKRRGDPQQSLRLVGTRCRVHHDASLYQATQDQQGLIPWNGKQDNLIDRFDGRALLDFIRENDGRFRLHKEKTEEEEELEEHVNFERFRDLIKLRSRGLNDEQGLADVEQQLEAKTVAPFFSDRQRATQVGQTSTGAYAQVAFTYDGNAKEDYSDSDGCDDDDDDDEEDNSSSEDSEDEEIEVIAKRYGVKRFNWLLQMDRKAKEEEKKQKEAVKGDPSLRKLSRKERRKASQQEREAFRLAGNSRFPCPDIYRELRGSPSYEDYSRSRRGRSRSRSNSPSLSRTRKQDSYDQRGEHESLRKKARTKAATEKIEYITEFGSAIEEVPGCKLEISPPSSPSQVGSFNWSEHWNFKICNDHMLARVLIEFLHLLPHGMCSSDVGIESSSGNRILEALHNDPAAIVGAPVVNERSSREVKGPISASSAIAKLNKPVAVAGISTKNMQGEKKETPQERLKRIMSKQLNKQIKKDTVTELAKRREQERTRQEKLAETRRIALHRRRSRSRSLSRSRSCSRSPPYRYNRRSRSPHRSYRRSPS